MRSNSALQGEGDVEVSQAMLACTAQLDETLAVLRQRYGTTVVIASLVAVIGCSNCTEHEVGQGPGKSLRELIVRLERHAAASVG